MAITVVPNPVNLQWSNFRPVPNLPNEDAHIDIDFNVPNRPFRRVNGRIMMAETFLSDSINNYRLVTLSFLLSIYIGLSVYYLNTQKLLYTDE